MARRYYLLILLVACLTFGALRVIVNQGGVASHRTQISFWNGWTGPDGVAMLRIIRRFNDQNPDVEVTMQRMDWANYYNKLMVAAMDNRGPQVFVIHASTLPRMRRAGFVADASDLYGPKTGILPSDFEDKVLSQVMFDGKRIGLPLDIHPQGMYYNSDDLLAAGWKNPDGTPRPPKNKDEFIQVIKATQKIAKDGSHDVWGFAWSMWRNNFMALVPQFGGHFFDKDGKADMNCAGNVAALSFMNYLMNTLKLVPAPEANAGWVTFRQKHSAMVWEGVYMVGDLARLADLHYQGAPIPQIGPQPGTLADSHVLCIREGLNPKQRDAVERFIKFLSANSLEWAKAGQVPARLSVRNQPAFKKLQVQYAFSKQVPYMVYPPRTTVLFEMTQEVDLAVEKVLRGRATPQQALDIANDNLKKIVERDKAENGS